MDNNKNIEVIRHSMSHVLASAVLKLFPDTKLGIGPAIANGFYYDFIFKDKITEDDFAKITEEMKKIINSEFVFEKTEVSKEDAISRMKELKQDYKVELISELEDGTISFYKTGDFTDLCRGPHIENTKYLKSIAWEIEKQAGAYFKGDEKNVMMTRIYVLCFSNRKELVAYKKMMEEAKRRDHRVIGKEMNLFHIDPIVGLGLPMWFPDGAMLWRVIEDFWYREHIKAGYELVRSPHIGNRKLWEISGHWGFYSDSMYPPIEVSKSLKEAKNGENPDRLKEEYLLKPMNCPFHVMLYKARPKSYKELPIRWAECGTVYR
jgi:threonyl-tRNA synthetase